MKDVRDSIERLFDELKAQGEALDGDHRALRVKTHELNVELSLLNTEVDMNLCPELLAETSLIYSLEIRDVPAELAPGRLARVVGVKAKPELNEQVGTLVAYDKEKGRWQVRVGTETKLVKAANLAVLCSGSDIRATTPYPLSWRPKDIHPQADQWPRRVSFAQNGEDGSPPVGFLPRLSAGGLGSSSSSPNRIPRCSVRRLRIRYLFY